MVSKTDRILIATFLANEINKAVKSEYNNTQEHQITAIIGERLKACSELKKIGNSVLIIDKQDIRDKGRASDETWLGADLFLAISTEGQKSFDKSLLIQAKKKPIIDGRCRKQCLNMLKYTSASYVWIYYPNEVRVVHANNIISESDKGNNEIPHGMSMRQFLLRIMECWAGSQKIGIPKDVDRKAAINQKISDFRVGSTLDIVIRQ